MKRSICLLAVLVAIFVAAQAVATGESCHAINVSGDPVKDSKLMIDIDWTIDTAKYKGDSTQVIRQKVAEEMWKVLVPTLVKKTSGIPLSFDRSNFTRVSETSKLIEKRADGSKVYSVNTKVEFDCERAANADQASSSKDTKNSQDSFDKELKYRFVREGID